MPSGQPPTSCLQSSNEDDATGAVEPENAGDSADFARPPISGDCGDLARIKALVPKPLGQDAIPTSRESGTEYRSRECACHFHAHDLGNPSPDGFAHSAQEIAKPVRATCARCGRRQQRHQLTRACQQMRCTRFLAHYRPGQQRERTQPRAALAWRRPVPQVLDRCLA
jgi:hypothetical protein